MARRRLEGLERVLGANALFSTAYGNVGSSIYYALGLVASYALGLTPVVFVITGVFFFMTAATYAEATAMYPEAGGSSSFARRAFNEFWSFFAAWAQMLTYTTTIAISAFFVPHYVGGLFWPRAAPLARRHHRRRDRDRRAGGHQRPRGQGVDHAERAAGGHRLPHPGAAGADRVLPGVLADDPGRQRPPRRRPDVARLHPRDPHRHARLHGHRDDLEPRRGGARRDEDDPDRDQPRAARGVRDLLHAAGRSRCRRCRSRRTPTASTRRCSG